MLPSYLLSLIEPRKKLIFFITDILIKWWPTGLPDLVPYLCALAMPSRILSTVNLRSISVTAPKGPA